MPRSSASISHEAETSLLELLSLVFGPEAMETQSAAGKSGGPAHPSSNPKLDQVISSLLVTPGPAVTTTSTGLPNSSTQNAATPSTGKSEASTSSSRASISSSASTSPSSASVSSSASLSKSSVTTAVTQSSSSSSSSSSSTLALQGTRTPAPNMNNVATTTPTSFSSSVSQSSTADAFNQGSNSGNVSGIASSGPNPGLIAGAVIASLAVVLGLGLLIVFLLKRRHRRRAASEADEFSSVRNFNISQPARGVEGRNDVPVLSYYQGSWEDGPLTQEKWGERPVNSQDGHSDGHSGEHSDIHSYGHSEKLRLDDHYIVPGSPYVAQPPSHQPATPPREPESRELDQHQDDTRRVADSLYADSVFDYYNQGRVSRSTTMSSRYSQSTDAYGGLSHEDAPPVPPMPPALSRSDTDDIYSRYLNADDHYNDIAITPPHSPVFDPANTAPLTIRAKGRMYDEEERSRDSMANPHDLEANKPAEDASAQGGYNSWVPAFLRKSDASR